MKKMNYQNTVVKLMTITALLLFSTATALSEMVLIPANQMSGIESWKEGQSWGAGNFFSSDGSAASTNIDLEGGEYTLYARIFTSPVTDADLRIYVNDACLIPPMQAKVHKLGWVSLGTARLPAGQTTIRVEPSVPGVAGDQNFAAIALCSTPFDDPVGRIMAFTEWLRHELIRLEAPKPAPRTLAEAQAQQEFLRRELLNALGLDPLPPRTPLNPSVTGRIEREGYSIEKVSFESRPNHVVPALLYLPQNVEKPVPAIVSAIGHWSYGKSSNAPQLRGIALAKQGYAVLALEACYAWERGIPGNSEGFEPFVAGGAIAGHMVWDIMRGVDYLETRPDIDTTRLGITGASGGGLQTFYAGAVDTRFKAVMPAVALWSMPELAINFYYSGDNWVPGISRMGGMGTLIALTAPRAMLVMNMDSDYSTSYACEVMVNAARPYYRLYGAENRILHTIEKGPHNYTRRMRENTCAFVDRWLKEIGDGLPVPEAELEKELLDQEDPALFVFENGKIPTENAATVQSIWTEQARTLRDALPAHVSELPERLKQLLNMPALPVPTVIETGRGFLVATDPGLQIAVLRLGNGSRAVVWLGESDCNTEAERPEVQALAEHATVFVVEPRGAGMPNEMHILRHAPIVMGRPLSGMWTYDLLCVVDYLATSQQYSHILVAGKGMETGLACLMAALFDQRITSAAIDGLFSSFAQLVGHSNPAPQIHGILKLADIRHLAQESGRDRIFLNNMRFDQSTKIIGLESSSDRSKDFFTNWLQ